MLVAMFLAAVFSGFVCFASVAHASESEYYAGLMQKKAATVEDMVRLHARFLGYEGEADMLEELRYLLNMGIRFRQDILQICGKELSVGNLSHMMLKTTGLKGGVMAWFFPSSQRYAVRQAIFLGLLKPGMTPVETVSGRELLGFMSRLNQILSVEEPS